MKKTIALILSLAMIVSLTACGGGESSKTESSSASSQTASASAETATPEPTKEATPEPTPEPTEEVKTEEDTAENLEISEDKTDKAEINTENSALTGSENESSETIELEKDDEKALDLVDLSEKDVVSFGDAEWIILSIEDEKIFMISKYCLAQGNFSEENDTTYSWESSQIRTWLNNEYYSDSFSADEQASILDTTVVNMRGENTTDKLYLLDERELEKYIPEEEERISGYTDGEGVWWWLRSPGDNKDTIACVNEKGKVLKVVKAYNIYGANQGIRPVMWVSKDADLKLVGEKSAEESEEPALYTKEEFLSVLEDDSFTEFDLYNLKADLPEKLTTDQLKEIIVGNWIVGSFDFDGNFVFDEDLYQFNEDGTAILNGREDYEWEANNDELIINDQMGIEFRKVADDCYWCYYVDEDVVAVYIKES